ncbi:hypothetical protein [Dactylococcopsis salina]|nr:hypothetical protein [Dactylococcopsis salina]
MLWTIISVIYPYRAIDPRSASCSQTNKALTAKENLKDKRDRALFTKNLT